jgi:hypothetical protein
MVNLKNSGSYDRLLRDLEQKSWPRLARREMQQVSAGAGCHLRGLVEICSDAISGTVRGRTPAAVRLFEVA